MRCRSGAVFPLFFVLPPRTRISWLSLMTASFRLGYSMPADIAPTVMKHSPDPGIFSRRSYSRARMPLSLKKPCSTCARRISPASTTTRKPCFRYSSTSSAAVFAEPAYEGSCFAGMLARERGSRGYLPTVKASAM